MEVLFAMIFAPIGSIWDFLALTFDPKNHWGLSVSQGSRYMGPIFIFLFAALGFTLFIDLTAALYVAGIITFTSFVYGVGMASGAIPDKEIPREADKLSELEIYYFEQGGSLSEARAKAKADKEKNNRR